MATSEMAGIGLVPASRREKIAGKTRATRVSGGGSAGAKPGAAARPRPGTRRNGLRRFALAAPSQRQRRSTRRAGAHPDRCEHWHRSCDKGCTQCRQHTGGIGVHLKKALNKYPVRGCRTRRLATTPSPKPCSARAGRPQTKGAAESKTKFRRVARFPNRRDGVNQSTWNCCSDTGVAVWLQATNSRTEPVPPAASCSVYWKPAVRSPGPNGRPVLAKSVTVALLN